MPPWPTTTAKPAAEEAEAAKKPGDELDIDAIRAKLNRIGGKSEPQGE